MTDQEYESAVTRIRKQLPGAEVSIAEWRSTKYGVNYSIVVTCDYVGGYCSFLTSSSPCIADGVGRAIEGMRKKLASVANETTPTLETLVDSLKGESVIRVPLSHQSLTGYVHLDSILNPTISREISEKA